jgi:hypothetical protein
MPIRPTADNRETNVGRSIYRQNYNNLKYAPAHLRSHDHLVLLGVLFNEAFSKGKVVPALN